VLALWFGVHRLAWAEQWPRLAFLWWGMPLLTLVADYCENICHFYFLRLHQSNGTKPPTILACGSFAVSWIKNAGFVIEVLTSFMAIIQGLYRIALNPQIFGWRGLVSLGIGLGTGLFVLAIVTWAVVYRLQNKLKEKKIA